MIRGSLPEEYFRDAMEGMSVRDKEHFRGMVDGPYLIYDENPKLGRHERSLPSVLDEGRTRYYCRPIKSAGGPPPKGCVYAVPAKQTIEDMTRSRGLEPMMSRDAIVDFMTTATTLREKAKHAAGYDLEQTFRLIDEMSEIATNFGNKKCA